MRLMTATDIAYVLFALTLAVLFWLAVALLLVVSHRYNHWLRRFGLIWIAANAGLFWLAAGVMRYMALERAYVLNMWSRVLYAMLALYVLGYALINWRLVKRAEP